MNVKHAFMKTYRLLLADLMTRLRWRFPALIALMSLVGLSEGTPVALLLPLLSGIGIVPSSNHGPATAMLDKALAAVGAVDSGSWSELMARKNKAVRVGRSAHVIDEIMQPMKTPCAA